jgi:hypothetical protein
MEVIEHEKGAWFLLNDEDHYFLDVNCNHSFFGFNMLIKLNDLELKQYRSNGIEYIESLARDVQYYATTKYSKRHILGETGASAHKAIMKFNNQNLG